MAYEPSPPVKTSFMDRWERKALVIMTRARRAELGLVAAVIELVGALESGVGFEMPEREAELRKLVTMLMASTPLDILIEISTANRPKVVTNLTMGTLAFAITLTRSVIPAVRRVFATAWRTVTRSE